MQLEQIALQYKMISMEAVNPSQSMEAMSFRMPSFLSGVVEFFRGAFDRIDVKLNPVDARKLLRYLNEHPYEEMANREVFIPEGLSGLYVDYANLLGKNQTIFDRDLAKALDDLYKRVSVALSSPEYLSNVYIKEPLYGDSVAELEGNNKAIAELFNAKVGSTTRFGNVFSRNGEWVMTCNLTNNLVGRLNGLDRSRLTKKMEGLNDLLTLLAKRIREDPETYRISGPQLETLSATVFNLATMMSHYSSAVHATNVLTMAVSNTGEYILKGK